MSIRPDEITSILQRELEGFESKVDVENVGTVLRVGDSIATVYGLQNVMAGELVELPHDTVGMVLNLEENSVGVAIFSSTNNIKEGDIVKRTNRVAEVPVGEELVGRVVNPLGQPIDGKGPIAARHTRRIESAAPNVISRKSVHEPLMTGIKAIVEIPEVSSGDADLICERLFDATEIERELWLEYLRNASLKNCGRRIRNNSNYPSAGPDCGYLCNGFRVDSSLDTNPAQPARFAVAGSQLTFKIRGTDSDGFEFEYCLRPNYEEDTTVSAIATVANGGVTSEIFRGNCFSQVTFQYQIPLSTPSGTVLRFDFYLGDSRTSSDHRHDPYQHRFSIFVDVLEACPSPDLSFQGDTNLQPKVDWTRGGIFAIHTITTAPPPGKSSWAGLLVNEYVSAAAFVPESSFTDFGKGIESRPIEGMFLVGNVNDAIEHGTSVNQFVDRHPIDVEGIFVHSLGESVKQQKLFTRPDCRLWFKIHKTFQPIQLVPNLPANTVSV